MRDALIDITKGKPVDKMAAMVTSQYGGFNSSKKIDQLHSHAPIKTVTFKKGSIKDHTGKKFGFFEVIGLFLSKGKASHRKLWVVRCICGRYETRTAKSIQNLNNKFDRCELCRELAYLKRKDEFNRTGVNKSDTLDY